MTNIERRVGILEAQLLTSEDREARKRADFLHECTDAELILLRRLAVTRANGEEPPALTGEEERMVSDVMRRWGAMVESS